jgi:hypothetical protein
MVPVSLFVGARYYRPVLERVTTKSGIATLLCSLGVYACGSYFGHTELHLVALVGMYLGFVVILGGRTHIFPVAVSLLPMLALVLPAIVPGLVATAVQLAVLASISVFVLGHWKGSSESSERCEYCASYVSSGSRSCLYCGRSLSGDAPRASISLLATGGALTIVLIVLALVTIPVITVTGTGVNYAVAGFTAVQPGNPILGSTSWTLDGVSSHAYPGLGMVFFYHAKGAEENLTVWEIVSPFRLTTAQVSTILPGFRTNSTHVTFGNTSLPIFTWTFENHNFTGFYGASSATVLSNFTKSQVSIAYLGGLEGQTPKGGGSSLVEQVVPVVTDRLSNAQKYSFLVSAALLPSMIGVYLQATGGVAVLLGVLGFTRGRELRALRIMENADGLTRDDFELFARLSSSGGEGTGKEILDRVNARFGITSWSGLLTKLQRFRELGLIQTRLRVNRGQPSLKWVSKVR